MLSWFLVRGHSMEPSAREGDFVFVWKLFYTPRAGDMAVFQDPDSRVLFLKRVVKTQGNQYWLEGDNKQDSQDKQDS